MSSKVVVIITSSDKEVVQTALMYAKNTLKYGWLEDVKTILFGPSEQLVANDPELASEVRELCASGEGLACKFISDNAGTSKSLAQLGLKIEYVGNIIANLIKDDYVPMVW
ncbi:MAG: hypothetical protein ACFFD8_11095 [Candidatus Thorarchaeota archaeon]